jgi:hypothetical protein
MNMVASEQAPTTQKSQLATIVTLFVIMRLTILFLYSPQGLFNAYTDYYFYYSTAQLSGQGYYPFVNMWYEYPPVSAYIPLAVYRLAQSILPMGDIHSFGYLVFAAMLGTIFLVFEAGVLVLLHQIAQSMWGIEKANWSAWIYTALSLPLFIWSFSHQAVVVFFLLLSIFWFITKKPDRSAVALGLGIVSKITPIFLLAPVIKFVFPKHRVLVVYIILTSMVVSLVYLPFVWLGGGAWIVASFVALTKVGSYSTIWAILDGNWSYGTFGPLTTRLMLDQASLTHSNPSVLPGALIIIIFALLYSLLFFRPVDRQDARHFIWFTTLTMIIFHVWLKGWSPQWALMFIPLFLLSFPNQRGLQLTLVLTGLTFIEWPIVTAFNSKVLLALLIILRTSFYAMICFLLAQQLWPAKRDGISIDKRTFI